MHQNRLILGLFPPQTPMGELVALMQTLYLDLRGPPFKGGGGKEKEGKGREWNGREGKRREREVT